MCRALNSCTSASEGGKRGTIMKTEVIHTKTKGRSLIRKCHVCGELIESIKEPEKCPSCKKSFLPSNYFGKVHAKNAEDFKNLFSHVEELIDEDLMKGIIAIW